MLVCVCVSWKHENREQNKNKLECEQDGELRIIRTKNAIHATAKRLPSCVCVCVRLLQESTREKGIKRERWERERERKRYRPDASLHRCSLMGLPLATQSTQKVWAFRSGKSQAPIPLQTLLDGILFFFVEETENSFWLFTCHLRAAPEGNHKNFSFWTKYVRRPNGITRPAAGTEEANEKDVSFGSAHTQMSTQKVW